jgi:N-methylhydantoinase A
MCYGKGGRRPTVTDANLVLGRIPGHLLGGEVPLSVELAREGVKEIATRLQLGVEETAVGILEIAAWNQANGIRQVSIQRGHDPRNYCLVSFGGSGGLLAGEVADALGIETVLVPPNPGNVSALGLQVSDVRRDYVRTLVRSEDEVDTVELETVWSELEDEGRAALKREGVPDDGISLVRSADARYVGEAHECRVVLGEGLSGPGALGRVWADFHDAHERLFGFAYRRQQPVEIVNLRVQAVGAVHRPALARHETDGTPPTAAPAGTRPVYFGDQWVDAPIYTRDQLVVGNALSGPAVIEEFGSTIVVFGGWSVRVDDDLNLIMTAEVR